MPTPDELYIQTINEQRDYLAKLQAAFNQQCDQIALQANEKLKAIPETDTAARKAVFDEQKKLLDTALSQLKTEIAHSGTANRHKLEEIHTQREVAVIANLETEMKSL